MRAIADTWRLSLARNGVPARPVLSVTGGVDAPLLIVQACELPAGPTGPLGPVE